MRRGFPLRCGWRGRRPWQGLHEWFARRARVRRTAPPLRPRVSLSVAGLLPRRKHRAIQLRRPATSATTDTARSRLLTDTSGTLTDSYDYYAFGNLVNSTGLTPNEFRSAGEQFDFDT